MDNERAIRIQCLQLASHPDRTPDQIVEAADRFMRFCGETPKVNERLAGELRRLRKTAPTQMVGGFVCFLIDEKHLDGLIAMAMAESAQ